MPISRHVLFICVFIAGLGQVQNSLSQNDTGSYVQSEDSSHTEPHKDISIPVRIVSTPYDQQAADTNAKAREENNQREEANLAIQRSVAESSQIVAQYTPHQFWLSFGSLVFSLATVGASGFAAWFAYGAVNEARKSTQIAQNALLVTEDTAKKQLRAYLVITGTRIPSDIPEGYFVVKTGFKNCGQTPAVIRKIAHRTFVVKGLLQPSDFGDLKMEPYNSVIGPGEDVHFHIGNTSSTIENFRTLVAHGQLNIAMRIQATYTDIYDVEHSIKFTRTIEGNRQLNSDFAMSPDYPDEFS